MKQRSSAVGLSGSESGRIDELFKERALQVRELLESNGYPKRNPMDSVYKDFRLLPGTRKSEIISNLEFFYELIAQGLSEGMRLKGDKRFTWLGLKRLGFRVPSQLFSVLDDNDIVEVYNTNSIQIFRNMDFCAICSYSLEDLLVYDFQELYSRDESLKGTILQQCIDYGFTSKNGQPHPMSIPIHFAQESFSRKRASFEVEFRYVSPLYGAHNQIEAILVSERITRLEQD